MSKKIKKKIILLFGPTASGKSRLAVDIAKEYNGEIVNADSMQVYKQLQILTARPKKKDLKKINILNKDPFITYASGSGIINVYSPTNGRTTGDTVRFRGSPHVSSSSDTFLDCEAVDGISGSTICRDAGYTITAGKYVSGSTDTSETDWYHFTASSNATTGGIKGGGYPVSAGPVTISAWQHTAN